MMIKAFVSDFDGTLVSKDLLDVICGIVGKEDDSRRLNEEFIAGKREGLPTLKCRIDFLRGVTLEQINAKLAENDYLHPGAEALFAYLRDKGIRTVLHSGNILPVIKYYQHKLGISDVVATKPTMNGNIVLGIEIADFPSRDFKAAGCKAILDKHGISKANIVAMGDAPSDLSVFAMAGLCIAVNPKGNIAEKVHHVIGSDLTAVIDILERVSACT